MKKISIDLEDELHKELLRIKYEKAMKDEPVTIGEMARQAIKEWIQKQKADEKEAK